MPDQVHIEAVERVLSAIYASGDRRLSAFMYGPPGSQPWEHRLGTEIYYRRQEYIRAVLFIRRNGAPYLRAMSVSNVRSLVTDFITENFWYVNGGNFLSRPHASYADHIEPNNKNALATALAASALFSPTNELTLLPLIPIRVEKPFECARFCLVTAADLSAHVGSAYANDRIAPTFFPPIADWDGIRHAPTSWLGVRSPLLQVSTKIASAVLGAVALTPQPSERYMFSGRAMFGGRCTLAGGSTVTMSDTPHTPAIMNDIVLTAADHPWLTQLASLVDADDIHSRKRVKALEYFYRAWFLSPRERFPLLCMSLDSLVGAQSGHTRAAVAFLQGAIEVPTDPDRLRLLMRVRGAVIHGAAPDVYESENYEKYYEDYEADPIRDIELIVAKCLRNDIFGRSLRYHANPHAHLIAAEQARGRLPARLDEGCIIPEDI